MSQNLSSAAVVIGALKINMDMHKFYCSDAIDRVGIASHSIHPCKCLMIVDISTGFICKKQVSMTKECHHN